MMRVVAILLTGLSIALHAAEPPVPVPAGATTQSSPARIGWRASQLATQSPTSVFRDLLTLTPAQREETLAAKPELYRNYLRTKLREYEGLAREERELRLKMVELRWHLGALMTLPLDDRADRLELVPAADRALVAERLKEWDALGTDARRELMENQFALDYFSRLTGRTVEQQKSVLDALTPERRAQLEAEFNRWHALPAPQRERIHAHFKRFFELDDDEQKQVVDALPPATRTEMQATLEALEKLPADQREQCLEALRKFTAMAPAERDEFLRNAERWKAMSDTQRDSWRSLVRRLPPMPPLPPGLVLPTDSVRVAPR